MANGEIGMEMNESNSRYIGDGVYAGFDGFGVWLHRNSHNNPDDIVFLEPQVLDQLLRFWKDVTTVPKYLCVVCHKNPVDAENGFDTCDECARKI